MSTIRRIAALAVLATAALALAPALPATAAASLDDVVLVADDNSSLGYDPVHDLHSGGPTNALYLDVLANDDLTGLTRSEYTVDVEATGEERAYVGDLWWEPTAGRVAISDLRGGQFEGGVYVPIEATQTLRYRICLMTSAECTEWAAASLTVTDTGPVPGAGPPAVPGTLNQAVPCAASSPDCYRRVIAANRRGVAYKVAYDYSRLLRDGGRAVLTENGYRWTPDAPERARYSFDAETGILTVAVVADAGWVTASGETVAAIPTPSQCRAGDRVYAVEIPPVRLNGPGGVSDRYPTSVGTEIADICAGGGGNPNPDTDPTRAHDDLATGQADRPIRIAVLANDSWAGNPTLRLVAKHDDVRVRLDGRTVVATVPRGQLAGRTLTIGRYRLCARGGCETAAIRVRTAPVIITGAAHEVPAGDAQAAATASTPGAGTDLRLPLGAGLVAMLGALGLAPGPRTSGSPVTRARTAAAAVLVGLLTTCAVAGLTLTGGAAVAQDSPPRAEPSAAAAAAPEPAEPAPTASPEPEPAITREPAASVEEARTEPLDLTTLQPGDRVPVTVIPEPPARPRVPMRTQRARIPARANVVEIPALNAVVRIERAPVRGGAMLVPGTLSRVGWMTSSPSPGARRGTTVLAGHRDGLEHGVERGPLYDLERVRIGALVRVRWHGEVTRYRVTSVRAYERRALPARLMRTRGAHEIAILTCTGPLVMGTDGLLHWSRNVVAYAREIR